MVIANSDSTNTLVSLNDNLKRVASLGGLSVASIAPENDFEATALRTPEDVLSDDDDYSSLESSCIYLPTESSKHRIDDCLQCIPAIRERCDEVLAIAPRWYGPEAKESVLYVGQGEIAHAVPLQCDVIMSDKATSCHILILRSVSDNALPLATCAHIDGTQYESCVRAAIQHHADHHGFHDKVTLDVHVVGGFEDDGSRKISTWLMRLLASVAEEHQDNMQMNLATCAVSAMNEASHGSPIGRGLALNLHSGEVFLASCDPSIAGPVASLRSARLWSAGSQQHGQLHVIHNERSNLITIQPFQYQPFADLPLLLALPDDLLLRCTSTSPHCEEVDFCQSVRRTLSYLRDVPCADVFGSDVDTPVVFRRQGRSNNWNRA